MCRFWGSSASLGPLGAVERLYCSHSDRGRRRSQQQLGKQRCQAQGSVMKMTGENTPANSEITMDDVRNLIKKKDNIEEQIKAYYDVLEDVSVCQTILAVRVWCVKTNKWANNTEASCVFLTLTARCRDRGSSGGRGGVSPRWCQPVPDQECQTQYFVWVRVCGCLYKW